MECYYMWKTCEWNLYTEALKKYRHIYLIYLSYILFKTCDRYTEMDMSKKFPS